MHREGQEVHVETDEARGGSTPHIVRWVLVISLALIVILFTLTFVIGTDQAQDQQDAAEGGAEVADIPDKA